MYQFRSVEKHSTCQRSVTPNHELELYYIILYYIILYYIILYYIILYYIILYYII